MMKFLKSNFNLKRRIFGVITGVLLFSVFISCEVSDTSNNSESLAAEYLTDNTSIDYNKTCFISIQVQRSNVYLNFRNPATFFASLIRSAGDTVINNYKHTFGHVTLTYGRYGEIFGYGETGDHKSEDVKLLTEGFGVTALTDFIFTDGHLQNSEEVDKDNISASQEGEKFAWMTFMVDEEAIDRLEAYIQKFSESKAYKNYAFMIDAKLFEGAVCTTFLNAALDASGVDIPMIDQWVRHLNVPSSLMGFRNKKLAGHEWAEYYGPEREEKIIWLTRIFTTFRWAEKGEGEKLDIYDPELFYNTMAWLESLYRKDTDEGEDKDVVEDSSPDVQRLYSVVKKFYQKHKNKISTGTHYETSGIIIDMRK